MIRLKHILLTLMVLTLFTSVQAQNKYEPTILILTPNNATADKGFEKEIRDYNKQIKKNQKQIIQESEEALKEIKDRAENFKIMYQKKNEFSKDMDLYSMIPSVAEGYLQYRFYERFTNLLIYAISQKTEGTIEELSALAGQHNMQYILNFPKVNSFLENGSKNSTITVQLYDNNQKKLLFENNYTGHDRNPGFEFTCSDSSLACTFNNALSQALGEVIYVVASNNPTIIRERKLAQERAEALFSTYYPKEPATEIVEIITQNDTSILTHGYYHGFIDDTKSKFIGFFAYNGNASNFQDIKDSKDKSINIITEDLTNLDDVPRIYAYIILGVKYNSKWYIQKSNVTYFNADDFETGKKEYFNNLQKWHFFKESASEFNPDFWELYFFSKIESSVEKNRNKIEEYTRLKEKETDQKYKEAIQYMIDDFYEKDLKNEGYFGLYSIVASEIKKQERTDKEQFEKELSEAVLTPFFDNLIKTNSSNVIEYKKLNGKRYALIYPKDKDVILCPILFNYEGDKSELHYYVLISNANNQYSFYKWDYFAPVTPKYKSMYGGDINDQLNTVTTWNFSFDYLQDRNFWTDYVLKKEGNIYLNLKKIK